MVLSRPKDYRMPFSKERTQQIKARLEECLDNDMLNQWERDFLANMSDLFDRFCERTRLSDAQYRFTLSLQVRFFEASQSVCRLGERLLPTQRPYS